MVTDMSKILMLSDAEKLNVLLAITSDSLESQKKLANICTVLSRNMGSTKSVVFLISLLSVALYFKSKNHEKRIKELEEKLKN